MYIPSAIVQSGRSEKQFDLPSLLLKDNIILLTGEFTDEMAYSVNMQLMYLNSKDKTKDIYLYINSPGGSVTAGLSIYDTMNAIENDIVTICQGQAASMGAFILSAGSKGKRISLPESRIMIHSVSSGTGGTVHDQRIQLKESEVLNNRLLEIMAKNCNKTPEELDTSTKRDNYMSTKEALEFGLIDKIKES